MNQREKGAEEQRCISVTERSSTLCDEALDLFERLSTVAINSQEPLVSGLVPKLDLDLGGCVDETDDLDDDDDSTSVQHLSEGGPPAIRALSDAPPTHFQISDKPADKAADELVASAVPIARGSEQNRSDKPVDKPRSRPADEMVDTARYPDSTVVPVTDKPAGNPDSIVVPATDKPARNSDSTAVPVADKPSRYPDNRILPPAKPDRYPDNRILPPEKPERYADNRIIVEDKPFVPPEPYREPVRERVSPPISRRVERNDQGQVTRITESTGAAWALTEDGQHYEMVGTGDKVPAEGMTISDDGSTFTFRLENGEQLRANSDGSVSRLSNNGREMTRANRDGSEISFDPQGRIISTTDTKGKTRQFQYDGQGSVATVREPSGEIWRSSDGRNWTLEGSSQTRTGQVTIGRDGSYSVKNNRDETTTSGIDGSVVTSDHWGRIMSSTDVNGHQRSFEYETDGSLCYVKDGDAVWRRVDANTWAREGSTERWTGTRSVDRQTSTYREQINGREVARRTDGWDEVTVNGRVTLERKDADGSTIVKNDRGIVSEVRYPDGQVRRFEYNAEGRVTRMIDRGVTWSSQDGQNWRNESNSETWQGQLQIGEDGIYRQVSASGRQKVHKTDGAVIETDTEGRATRITAANGKIREFEYGAEGNLTRMRDGEGNYWGTTDGTTWVSERTRQSWSGSVTVAPDGTYEERRQNGARVVGTTDGRIVQYNERGALTRVDAADGRHTTYSYEANDRTPSSIVTTNRDGSELTYNARGQITKVKDSNGAIREFGYAENGTLNRVKGPDGATWTTADGNNWSSDRGQSFTGRAYLTPEGVYSRMQGQTLISHELNGTLRTREPSGAVRVQNPAGQIIETTDARGTRRTYGFDASGNPNRYTEGDATWLRRGDKDWVRQDNGVLMHGSVELLPDGTHVVFNHISGDKVWHKPDGSTESADWASISAACQAINESTSNYSSWLTEKDKFNNALDGKTLRQRQRMNEAYQWLYGRTIEEEIARSLPDGHHQEAALALLRKPDGADNAGAVRLALVENESGGFGAW